MMSEAKHRRFGSRRPSERGLTLLEMLMSLSILGGVVVGVTQLAQSAGEDTRASITALHTRTVGDAASAYIKDNFAAITGIATPTTPVLIRVPDLVATGYLSPGFSVTNPRQQATCVLVLEPTANRLAGLVVTEGGDTLDDLTLGQVAAAIGGAGGGLYSGSPTIARGAMGGYAFADGAQASSTLYRDSVPGNPALNTMNTPILMGAGAQETAGTACVTPGAIASSASGAVLACEGGTWKQGGSSFWQDPVATFGALPTCNAAALNQTRVVRTPAVGSGARAYTCNGAGVWQPLGVNDAGNLTVAGTVTTADLSSSGTATVNRLGGTLEIGSVATQGAGCAPSGRLARTAAGAILSCEAGVWTLMSSQAASGTLCGHYGDVTGVTAYCMGFNPGSSCPTGYTRVMVAVSYGGCCGIYNYSCAKN